LATRPEKRANMKKMLKTRYILGPLVAAPIPVLACCEVVQRL
jgi:hypothetical protein